MIVAMYTRLIIESSFELTFWIRLNSKSNCSHFQLDSSRVEHIFNSTRLDSTENWVNLTRLVKNSSLASRELNIENFPVFDFCIIFLHYLLIESHEGKNEDRLIESHKEKHEDHLIESHNEKHEGKHEEKHEEEHEEKHDEKTWRSFDFDRESWRKNMIESHEEKSCRLFDQAIYIYLISCRVESSFQVELLNQASQLDSSAQIQLLNSTRHFSKKISTRLDAISLMYTQSSLQGNSIKVLICLSLNRWIMNILLKLTYDVKFLFWILIMLIYRKVRSELQFCLSLNRWIETQNMFEDLKSELQRKRINFAHTYHIVLSSVIIDWCCWFVSWVRKDWLSECWFTYLMKILHCWWKCHVLFTWSITWSLNSRSFLHSSNSFCRLQAYTLHWEQSTYTLEIDFWC